MSSWTGNLEHGVDVTGAWSTYVTSFGETPLTGNYQYAPPEGRGRTKPSIHGRSVEGLFWITWSSRRNIFQANSSKTTRTKQSRIWTFRVLLILSLFEKAFQARENELRERIPVPHDNFFKSILSSRACCEGYFGLLFPWPARVYFHVNVTCFMFHR